MENVPQKIVNATPKYSRPICGKSFQKVVNCPVFKRDQWCECYRQKPAGARPVRRRRASDKNAHLFA